MEIRAMYSLQIMRKIQRIRSTYFAFKKCAESPKLDLIENSIITKRKKKYCKIRHVLKSATAHQKTLFKFYISFIMKVQKSASFS